MMRLPLCALLLAFLTPALLADGAEGFGSETPGGKGGKRIAVTTLADAGPGSLREAVKIGRAHV